MAGQIGWIELHATNSDAAATFYETVFGWQILRDPSTGDYIMFKDSEGGLGGGFTASMPKAGGQLYLMTDDIEQTLTAVVAAGGAAVKGKTLIDEAIGWWGQFTDTEGNVMGLFQRPAA